MRAFVKTLVGDGWNLSVVAVVMLAAVLLVFTGHAHAAAFVVPPSVLVGIAWLAWR